MKSSRYALANDSRVAVVGGGPAGSFFAYFLLVMAQRAGKTIQADIYEPRDFSKAAPGGCNNCGGIVSEWLVQALAADGINLPAVVLERGIDSYVMHLDVGDAQITTRAQEKRIGAVFRGAGPRGIAEVRSSGFDGFLLQQAQAKGACVIGGRVDGVELREGRPFVKVAGGEFQGYDLLTVAMGKNNAGLRMFEKLGFGYVPPRVSKTYITEILLGRETVARCLGTSMHVFLPDMPRLKFAAIIPKGDYATICMLGEKIDRGMVEAFVNSPEVKRCMPPGWVLPADACHCSPWIAVGGAAHPFADRVLFIGDCGVTRLYKDGIGAAYRAAKATAVTAVFEGVAASDFQRHYAPLLANIAGDNQYGRIIFLVTTLIQRLRVLRRGVLRMVAHEQAQATGAQRLSTVLWDTFTGSAPYREVFLRTLHPGFWLRFLYEIFLGIFSFTGHREETSGSVPETSLGRQYHDGDLIVRQGELGDTMFVVQAGQARVVQEQSNGEVFLNVVNAGEFFGEMSIIERRPRSASVFALGETRVLTVDKRTFQRRVREDPSLAYRILQKMSRRIRTTSEALAAAQASQAGEQAAAAVATAPESALKSYRAGEVLMREGEAGSCLFVIQSGQVEVVKGRSGTPTRLALCRKGDFLGEMALFEDEVRSATVRALSDVSVLVLDRPTFLQQVHQNPALAYQLMEKMSGRIRELNASLPPFATAKIADSE